MDSKTKFQKFKARKNAFYIVLALPSKLGYEIVMCYQKEIAEALAVCCCLVVIYRTMLRFCGCGRLFTFFNFYLS